MLNCYLVPLTAAPDATRSRTSAPDLQKTNVAVGPCAYEELYEVPRRVGSWLGLEAVVGASVSAGIQNGIHI